MRTIFSRFLSALGVPHTGQWSDRQFRGMTFKSLYGLSHLLNEYGVPNRAYQISDKTEFRKLTPPFLAQTRNGIFVIVNDIDPATDTVRYDSLGSVQTIDTRGFINAWNGIALCAFPENGSGEPEYLYHRISDIVRSLSGYILVLAAITVAAYFIVTRQIYAHPSVILLTLFDMTGLYLSYMLLQKSLNIHTAISDHVCGVLERGGCDTIMSLKVSKLFGVFSWSEVGFGYFGVSLVTLLVFPHLWPSLALCNVCCLPYTFWSIWYQRFRAHHWCTLCVGVQTTLWLLFFCYLGGGWFRHSFPLHPDFFILIAVYIFSVLLINKILGIFRNIPCHEKDNTSST